MSLNDSAQLFEARGLTKKYGRRAALNDVTLTVPGDRVVGLVGPNGAGKSTLLNLACGLLRPTSGTLRVLGSPPAENAAHLARVGFVAQDTPVYPALSVADHLRMGTHLNPTWDQGLAERRLELVGLNPRQKAGRLSGGQRAQLSMTIAAAKRPELLIFDEPAAALDPLARHEFLENLMEFVSELGASAVLSSHLLGDIERVCNYLIVLCDARVQVAGDVRELLTDHHKWVGSRDELDRLPADLDVIRIRHDGPRRHAIVRASSPTSLPEETTEPLTLEELVLAYMTRATAHRPTAEMTAQGEAL